MFGPVWTTLHLLMGVALALARRASPDDRRGRVEAVFGLQLALNLGWSVAFFMGRSPAAGVAVILVPWASIVATIMEFGGVQRSQPCFSSHISRG